PGAMDVRKILVAALFREKQTSITFDRADLRAARFDGAFLSDPSFYGSNLGHVSFHRAFVMWGDFDTSQLRYADFDGAYLGHGSFSEACVSHAHFRMANLFAAYFDAGGSDVDFTQANLKAFGTGLDDAVLHQVSTQGAWQDDRTQLSDTKT